MNELVIVSMDVIALYPSISISLASQTITRIVKESNIEWEGLNVKTLGRYLTINFDSATLRKHKIEECVPIAKPRTIMNSWTNPSREARERDSENQFVSQNSESSMKQTKTMIALAISKVVEVCKYE